jgi:hypothetical protein
VNVKLVVHIVTTGYKALMHKFEVYSSLNRQYATLRNKATHFDFRSLMTYDTTVCEVRCAEDDAQCVFLQHECNYV